MRGESGPPLAPRKSGPSDLQRVGALCEIGLDRGPHRRDDRRDADLAALARYRELVDFADRRIPAPDRKRLADAQSRAVAQRQNGGVASENPGIARLAVPDVGRRNSLGVGNRERPRQPAARARRA